MAKVLALQNKIDELETRRVSVTAMDTGKEIRVWMDGTCLFLVPARRACLKARCP